MALMRPGVIKQHAELLKLKQWFFPHFFYRKACLHLQISGYYFINALHIDEKKEQI